MTELTELEAHLDARSGPCVAGVASPSQLVASDLAGLRQAPPEPGRDARLDGALCRVKFALNEAE